jgi:stage II sporulation protein GA (sporulation sigma-E factor processing peptidase)
MDSGNCLYDPVFKKPVMVVENSLIRDLLPSGTYLEFEAARKFMEQAGPDHRPPDLSNEHVLRFRFIPYQSIGKMQGMMLGLVLDKVLIHTEKETVCNEKVTAAICDNHLSAKDDYHVLLHKELI